MSISTYKRWMKESYLYEADDDKEEHKKGDVWQTEKGNWQAIGPSGDQESFGKDKEAAERHANPEDKGDEEKPKCKGLKASDFERDFDDSEPEDKPFGGDTGKDADSETGKDYVSKFQGTDEPEDDEEAKAQAFKDMEDEFGDEDEEDMEEEIITINGKKYRPIKESVEPKKHLLREMYERIGGK